MSNEQFTKSLQAQPAAGSSLPSQPESPVALARVAEAVATIRASVEVAYMNRRDESGVLERALEAMRRPKAADQATYLYQRGGTDITGPSVRLARELARVWGNIQHGLRIISSDDNEVHIEGWAWDLESNMRTARESKFAKKIQRKRGDKTVWITPDERDLDELIARRGAKLTRNAILELLPDYLIDEALAQAYATLREEEASKKANDPQAQIADACATFEGWGVKPEQLLAAIGGEWSSEGLAKLRQIYNSIRDGNSKVDEHFAPPEQWEAAPAGGQPRDLADIGTKEAPPSAEAEGEAQTPTQETSPAQGAQGTEEVDDDNPFKDWDKPDPTGDPA